MWTCLSQLSEDKTCVLKIQLEKIPIYKRIRTIWFPVLWGNCTYCTVSSLRVTIKHKVRIKRRITASSPLLLPSQFSLVQFSRSVVSNSLQPHELQHAMPPCPSPSSRVHSNPCPLSQWCHPAISSSVFPFSSYPQSFPASGSFPMSQLFASGGQSIGVSASTSVLPMNTQDWSPLGWTGWIPLQSKGLSRVFSNTTVQKHQLFSAQLSLQSNSHIHTWPLEKPQPWPDGPLLAK